MPCDRPKQVFSTLRRDYERLSINNYERLSINISSLRN